MRDYLALLNEPRIFENSSETEPSKPSKGAFEGNDGSADQDIENLAVPKLYISSGGDLVIPFNSDRKYHYWCGGQSVLDTLREICAEASVIRKYESP